MRHPLEMAAQTPRAPSKPNGYVVYDGPSLIDGKRIVVILTGLRGGSANTKTGAMVASWILCADVAPLEALSSGADESVCGDCIHRQADGAGSCYVNVAQGPNTVHDAWTRGVYPTATPGKMADVCAGRDVRLGNYGDPAAVPAFVWLAIISRAASHTGYTHQWRRARVRREYRTFLMASADSEDQARRAWREGWRTFRVKGKQDARLAGEIVCPASEEAGKKRTCQTCAACDGAGTNAGRRSIVIDVHGLVWKAQRYALAQRALRQKKRFRVKGKKIGE